jgi:hypothetical protein
MSNGIAGLATSRAVPSTPLRRAELELAKIGEEFDSYSVTNGVNRTLYEIGQRWHKQAAVVGDLSGTDPRFLFE